MKHSNREGRPLFLGLDGPAVEFEVPRDPTATIYPMFWQVWEDADPKPEFHEVFPDKPDRFMPVEDAPTGRTSLSPLQALRRNPIQLERTEPATEEEIDESDMKLFGSVETPKQKARRRGELPALTGDDEPPAPGTGTHPTTPSSPEGTEPSS